MAGVSATATYLRSSKFALAPEDHLSQRMGGKIDMVLRELDIPVPTPGKSVERAHRIMPTRAVLDRYDRLRHDIILCLSLQKHVARLEAVVGEELKRRDDVKVAKAEKNAARAAAKRKRDEEVVRRQFPTSYIISRLSLSLSLTLTNCSSPPPLHAPFLCPGPRSGCQRRIR